MFTDDHAKRCTEIADPDIPVAVKEDTVSDQIVAGKVLRVEKVHNEDNPSNNAHHAGRTPQPTEIPIFRVRQMAHD
jgi:hypothetical protein